MQYASVYILIAVTIGFYFQMQKLQNTELGFDGSQVLTIRTPMKDQADFDKIEYLKKQVERIIIISLTIQLYKLLN